MYSLKGDEALVVFFRNEPVENEAKTAAEGRPIFEDREVVEMRGTGTRNNSIQPATMRSHWGIDPATGRQIEVTYAERFAKQYRQFKEHQTQTKSGTPLAHAPFLTEARRAELRALNCYTVEQLALVDGQELRNLGQGGRELKNQAIEYLSDAKNKVPGMQLVAELEAERAKNAVLREDLEAARKAVAAKPDSAFDDMSDNQLKELIKSNTGHAPQGEPNRKTLVRMATETRRTG